MWKAAASVAELCEAVFIPWGAASRIGSAARNTSVSDPMSGYLHAACTSGSVLNQSDTNSD